MAGVSGGAAVVVVVPIKLANHSRNGFRSVGACLGLVWKPRAVWKREHRQKESLGM